MGDTVLLEGSSATFSAHIVDSVSPGYDSEYITGITYSFSSGDGQTRSGTLSGLWTSALDLSATFNYGSIGSYAPYFTSTVNTTDQYHYWVDTSYFANSGYWYSCGFLSSCWQNTSHWVYQGYTQYNQTNLQSATSSSTSLNVAAAPIPEPETYAMMLAGLGLLGFMARRRKQKEAA